MPFAAAARSAFMPVGAAAYAAAALRAKGGGYVEHGRWMGRRHGPGPWTPERRQKMRETLNSMSSEALRYCRIEHKSRWLTRLIVVHADKKVFAFDGIDPWTRRRFKMHLEFPLDVTLSEFLTVVMNCPDAPMTMRLDAGKNAAALVHKRPRQTVTVTVDRRPRRSSPPSDAPTGSPEWRARISAAVKIGLARRRERLSAVAAASLADDEAADG
jgi:hypothetical protein